MVGNGVSASWGRRGDGERRTVVEDPLGVAVEPSGGVQTDDLVVLDGHVRALVADRKSVV